MISHEEKEIILSKFPNIKLSYGTITHKKVSNVDFIMAIPKGQKCFVWFTKYNLKNVCFIMELMENKQVKNIKKINICLNNDLYNETIFYGTIFNTTNNKSNSKFFTIEDLYFYKGKNISSTKWENKFVFIKNILENIMENENKKVFDNKFNIIFGLPLINNNFDNLVKEISQLSYNIYCLHFKYYHKFNNFIMPIRYVNEVTVNEVTVNEVTVNEVTVNEVTVKDTNDVPINFNSVSLKNMFSKEENTIVKKNDYNENKFNKNSYKMNDKREKVFLIKPDIQNDIYYLYSNNNGVIEYFDIAYIPDYKTSVMMNNLFRNIKENKNLDALEESDDEEEFQNEKEDRFVYLDKSYNMTCHYNYKFKKWYPIHTTFYNEVKKCSVKM